MTEHLQVYDKEYINKLTRNRSGEIKLGEKVDSLKAESTSDLTKQLKLSKAKYVLLGLPEDIGVRANLGRGGTYSAWNPALTNLLNIQSNAFLSGEEILILGHINFDDLMIQVDGADFKKEKDIERIRNLVSEVDDRVYPVINSIMEAGKEAIIIGGGHNNAYPNLKGAAEGLKAAGKISSAKINAINCDAHADFRPAEGRHSGNGFRYASDEGFLDKYSVIGMHESYNSSKVLNEMLNDKQKYSLSFFEDIFIRETLSFKDAVQTGINHVTNNYCGLEIDMDTVQNIPSSAKTSSGINTIQARQYITWCAEQLNCSYLHIAEAAPILSHIKTDNKTGKLIAYLITDYIKGRKKYKVQGIKT